MKAIRFHAPGGPEVLRCEDVALADPGPGEVTIRQTAIGVNFIDTYHRSGLYPLALPSGVGTEAAGVVERVGPESPFAIGDRVAYAGGPPGAYAEARVMPAARLVKLPDAIDDATAAAVMLKGMTVEYLVRRTFPVQRGQTVLWHAAAGGVGLIACQWLRAIGAITIGTVSSEAKAALARENGCAHTVIYTREDFAARARALTGGEGVPVVFDSVGKTTFEGSIEALALRGMLVSFGNASGRPPPIDFARLQQKALFCTRPALHHYTHTRQELLESASALFEMIESGAVQLTPPRRFPLSEAADAHRALEARSTTGSTVLVP